MGSEKAGEVILNGWKPYDGTLSCPENGVTVAGCGPNEKYLQRLDIGFVTVERSDGERIIRWRHQPSPTTLLYWRDIPPEPINPPRRERHENGFPVWMTLPIIVPTEQPTPEEAARISTLFRRAPWKFASSMPENPHEYSLRRFWKDSDFEWVISLMWRTGYLSYFWRKPYIQFNTDGHQHWTMGHAIDYPDGSPWTMLINRKSLIEKAKPQGIVD